MHTSLLFKHAQVVTPEGIIKADVLIKEGKIAEIGSIEPTENINVVECMGMYLLPGGIDMHVHFRDPGFTQKEDFETGSLAAASGGVTTVVDMPNTNPATTTMQALEVKREAARKRSHVNTYFHFGATQDPYNIDEIRSALAEPDVMAVKVCMARTTGSLLVTQTEKLEEILSVATELGKFCIIHAEDNDEVSMMEQRFANAIDPRTHSLIRNPMTAYAATKRIIHLAKKVGARVHITHLSTALEVDELRKCGGKNTEMQKRNAFSVSSDCTPHHLFLTDDAYTALGNMAKVNPPLRFDEDKEALWKAISEGLISCVATDHAPHLRHEKSGSYPDVPAGMPGVETMLPLLLDAVNHGELTLTHVVELVSKNPAAILGLTTKGALSVGMDADVALVDMNKTQKIGEHGGPHNGYYTKSGWSPFEGREVKGWPIMTVVGGKIVWQA